MSESPLGFEPPAGKPPVGLAEQLLARREGKTLEFKRDASSIKPILRTLVAFANTAGGHLVIGCSDRGAPVGVADPLADELRLANAVASGIVPALLPDFEFVSIDDATLIVVYVPRWRGPAFVKAEGPDDGVYVRLGSTTRRVDAGLLAELRREMAGISYDAMPCEGAARDSLDDERLTAFASAVGQPLTDELLASLQIIVPTPRGLKPSNAGLVLFATDQERDRLIHETWVQAARFVGVDKANFLDRSQLRGAPLEVLDEAARFIARNTRLAARFTGEIRRTDVPEYPRAAVREALVNAIAHRDYSMTDMPIRVAVFSDRLEIESPGTLPHGLTLDDLKRGVSRPRNRVIARVLRELDVMEAWGSGYRRISQDCSLLGHPLPEWHEVGPVIRAVFSPHPETVTPVAAAAEPISPSGDTITDTINDLIRERVPADVLERLNPRQVWFLGEVALGRRPRVASVVERWAVSPATAKRDLKTLREQGLVEYLGPQKTGEWRLTRG